MSNSKVKNPKNPTSTIHAFRSDQEITQLLNRLPNKTDFILTALKNAFAEKQYVKCPQCKGLGKIYKPRKKNRR